jgi:hypothetical protein
MTEQNSLGDKRIVVQKRLLDPETFLRASPIARADAPPFW